MVQCYELRVLGPLPERAQERLAAMVVGCPEATTVLGTTADDSRSLSAAMSRVSCLGLELVELRRGPHRTELEVNGPLGPALQAALADMTVAMARRRCVLSLRTSGRTLVSALRVLTEQGVDLLSVRPARC